MTAESDLGPLPHWDLSNIYPDLESEEFKQAVAQLKTQLDKLDGYMSDHQIARAGAKPADSPELAETIGGYLDRTNELLRLYGTLRAYVHGFVSTDSYNTTAKRILSELEMLGVRLERQEVLFRGWVGMIAEDPDVLPGAVDHEGPAKEHAFYLQETAEQSRYLMSEAEEALAAEVETAPIWATPEALQQAEAELEAWRQEAAAAY